VHCQPAGTDSVEKLEVKWLIPVSACTIVVRMRLAGSVEPTQQWLMGLSSVKCVLTGLTDAVFFQPTSVFVTVEGFTFTNICNKIHVTYVTVAMDLYRQPQVGVRIYVSLYQKSLVNPC